MAHDGVLVDAPLPAMLRVRLNRPQRRNALDRGLVAALREFFARSDPRVIVVASSDTSVFSSGADLDIPDGERALLSDELYELYEQMLRHPAPIISVVEGSAVGGGAHLALASDLRIGGPGARLRFSGLGNGLVVGAWALPGIVGVGRAIDLSLSMRWVDAAEAQRIGLLTRVVQDPMAAASDAARTLLACDAAAVSRAKAAFRDATLFERIATERAANRASWDGSVRTNWDLGGMTTRAP